jgi:uncharacterized protein
MPNYREVRPMRTLVCRLSYGADLLGEITGICLRENIRLGKVEAIGAVKKARVAYYDQGKRVYCHHEIDKPLEIVSLIGNISIKDNKPIVHAHVVLADADGATFGGHLAQGTLIFACECIIREYQGGELTRGYDEQTGLPLWTMPPPLAT